MYFIDEAKIYLKAGNGGDGAVSFYRAKYIDMGGPDGGDGGRGGSIIFRSNAHLNTLVNFKYKQHFKADNGENGKGSNRSGKSKPPLILQVPVGTQIFSTNNEILLLDLIKDAQEAELITGSKGGLGNSHFKSSINQAPRRSTKGEVGEEMWVNLQLKLLSDVGIIGLPNAGKSTFLSTVTSAKPRIADYPFTTLIPALGVVYIDNKEFVLADIPGLIEGAHAGRGLGDKFLKHIERCNVLIHLIDATSNNISIDYRTIRHELESYSQLLQNKLEIICLNKCDILSDQEIQDKIQELQQITKSNVYPVSTYTTFGISRVIKLILEIINSIKMTSEIHY